MSQKKGVEIYHITAKVIMQKKLYDSSRKTRRPVILSHKETAKPLLYTVSLAPRSSQSGSAPEANH